MSIQDYFIMGSELLSGWSVDDVREWLTTHTDQQSIIDAYAAVHNQAIWIEDEEYDYEKGTTAYAYACEPIDAWFALMNELQEIVFGYLRDEGIKIPDRGYNSVLASFMEQHGYRDGNGWWVQEMISISEPKKRSFLFRGVN